MQSQVLMLRSKAPLNAVAQPITSLRWRPGSGQASAHNLAFRFRVLHLKFTVLGFIIRV